MKKLILILIVLAAILFGGKIGLEYYYAKKLDELIAQARIVADIDYRNVRIDQDGSIAVNGLTVRPHSVDTLVRVDAVTLFSSDRLLPIKLGSLIEKGDIPNELGLRIAGMEYDPSVFEAAFERSRQCRYLETTFISDNLAINRLNADIEMSMQINGNNGVLSLSSTDQTAVMNAKVLFDASSMNPAVFVSDSQPINELALDYTLKESVASELVDTCASMLGMSTNEYLSAVVASPDYMQVLGANFGASAQQALVSVMQGGKRLSVKSKPSSALSNPNNLSFYQANDIVRLLGLTVSVDSTEIELDITELQADETEGDETAGDASQLADVSTGEAVSIDPSLSPEEQERIRLKAEALDKKNAEKYSYKATPVGDLGSYINYSVIVKRTGNKKQMRGELIAIDSDTFSIETGQYGGKAKFTITKTDVLEVEVYR